MSEEAARDTSIASRKWQPRAGCTDSGRMTDVTKQTELFLADASRVAEATNDDSPLWWAIQGAIAQSSQFFVKKLSRNDTSWADDSRKHQAGFYIPRPIRDSGFFPPLQPDNPDKPHIFHAACRVLWPQTGETTVSHMRHFSNKGTETHFTGLVKPLFRSLAPASLLLIGKFKEPVSDCRYWIVVLDSITEEAELLETVLDVEADFHFGLFHPSAFEKAAQLDRDETTELIERLQAALRGGTLPQLLTDFAKIPDPAAIAMSARQEWLEKHHIAEINPWEVEAPGDAIMEISRDIEYRIFRRFELRRRAAEVVGILAGETDLVTRVVRGFAELDAVFLSASQQRKTRAGRSFEQHIAATLTAGRIRFIEQAVTGGRRPDFVLPDVKELKSKRRSRAGALVLAAKTTLRERWKQVSSERLNCDVFLATVDDRVPATSIKEMTDAGIRLVVPESLKASDEACYAESESVLSFRVFFDHEIRSTRPFLLLAN